MPLENTLKDGFVLAFPAPIARYRAPKAEVVNPRLRERCRRLAFQGRSVGIDGA
jgi:hypothetical protein